MHKIVEKVSNKVTVVLCTVFVPVTVNAVGIKRALTISSHEEFIMSQLVRGKIDFAVVVAWHKNLRDA